MLRDGGGDKGLLHDAGHGKTTVPSAAGIL